MSNFFPKMTNLLGWLPRSPILYNFLYPIQLLAPFRTTYKTSCKNQVFQTIDYTSFCYICSISLLQAVFRYWDNACFPGKRYRRGYRQDLYDSKPGKYVYIFRLPKDFINRFNVHGFYFPPVYCPPMQPVFQAEACNQE